jgi:hypothetical protein
MKVLIFVGALLSLCYAPKTFANSIIVGDLEFNNLFSGVNYFTVDDFTGSNNLGFFPVATDVTFDNSVLTLTELGGDTLVFGLGDIGPGANTNAEFSDTLSFTEATFSATLHPSSFRLTNGDSGTFIADPSLSFTLLPSSGSTLVAGIDLGTMSASPASSATVPEPSTLTLWLTALGAVLGLKARRRRLPGGKANGIYAAPLPTAHASSVEFRVEERRSYACS